MLNPLDVLESALNPIIECGRSGEDGRFGLADGVRRGTRRKVEDFRPDDNGESTGRGLGPGEVCGVLLEEEGPAIG